MASRGLPRSHVRSRVAPAAARTGAAALGSRSGRRQIRAVLDVARATNACSVSFALQHGAVQGFTIYMENGSYMHAGTEDVQEPTAAAGAGPQDAARDDAQRKARARAVPPDTSQGCLRLFSTKGYNRR